MHTLRLGNYEFYDEPRTVLELLESKMFRLKQKIKMSIPGIDIAVLRYPAAIVLEVEKNELELHYPEYLNLLEIDLHEKMTSQKDCVSFKELSLDVDGVLSLGLEQIYEFETEKKSITDV